MWFHSYLAERGYCNPKKPNLKKRIGGFGNIFFYYRFTSYTFSSLNWLHDMFSTMDPNLNRAIKIIPANIADYLTPLALAIWFMDEGSVSRNAARIATNCFTYNELLFLCKVLQDLYNISASVQSAGPGKGFIIYISTYSMPTFIQLIKPYMLSSMLYKLGI
jgi:hypothetical protein